MQLEYHGWKRREVLAAGQDVLQLGDEVGHLGATTSPGLRARFRPTLAANLREMKDPASVMRVLAFGRRGPEITTVRPHLIQEPPMATKQLRPRDLAPGDIMLKVSDGSAVSKLIAFGQGLVGQRNASVVHAAVMFDRTYMVEAVGRGVIANDIRVGNASYAYLVFRARNPSLAKGAGTFAKILFDVQQRRGNLGYSVAAAIGSLGSAPGKPKTRAQMDDMMDRILAGRSHPNFCSQLVVMVYQFTAEQNGIPARSLFPFSDPKVSPSELASHLSKGGMFREMGYLMAGER